jgi:hypothetical protein
VKSISRGGYLTISKSTGRFFGDTQSFEARETGGTIERKYNVNGKTLTGDEGRAWLRTFLPELLREMAINADRRVARTLAKGGPASVLELVSSVKGEYAKGVYMRELYAQAALDAPTLSRSLQQAGAEISSDYDLAQVLKTASEKQNIDATLPAFVEASRTIQSDYDLRGVLSRALARPSLTPSVASAIFKAAIPGPGGAGIDSDYDMAELLKDAPVSMVNQPGSGWAEAVGSISSAYDRHRAIAAVLRPGASPEVVEAALTSAAGLSSDYEAANLLIEIIKAGLLTDRTSHAFMSAASHIGSAYDRQARDGGSGQDVHWRCCPCRSRRGGRQDLVGLRSRGVADRAGPRAWRRPVEPSGAQRRGVRDPQRLRPWPCAGGADQTSIRLRTFRDVGVGCVSLRWVACRCNAPQRHLTSQRHPTCPSRIHPTL